MLFWMYPIKNICTGNMRDIHFMKAIRGYCNMGKITLTLFFSFTLLSYQSFSQVVEEIIQLDTVYETYKVIYKPTVSTSYYKKKIAVFANDTSQIAIEKTYTSYGQNGVYKVYYPTGRLKVFTVFANDKINGEWTWYDKKGVILIKGVYKNGELEGTSKEYYENGELYIEEK